MAVDTRKEAVENFIQSVLKDHVLSEGMPRTQSDTQDAYATVELLRSFLEKCDALEAQVKAADALAEALTPFAVTLERYSGFTEYAVFGIWEDVNGAAGRKLNILRMANFDDAKAALAAYLATKEGGA